MQSRFHYPGYIYLNAGSFSEQEDGLSGAPRVLFGIPAVPHESHSPGLDDPGTCRSEHDWFVQPCRTPLLAQIPLGAISRSLFGSRLWSTKRLDCTESGCPGPFDRVHGVSQPWLSSSILC